MPEASFAANGSADIDEGTMVSLLGNVVWAVSPYLSEGPYDGALMAIGGALTGTLGPAFIAEGGVGANDVAENEYRRHHDQLVELVWDSLVEAGLDDGASYSTVNARVAGAVPQAALRAELSRTDPTGLGLVRS